MDFIKEIEPYIQYLNLFLDNKGIPNKDILKNIVKIYDKSGIPDPRLGKTDVGCGACIDRVIRQLKGKYDREKLKPIFKTKSVKELKEIAKANGLKTTGLKKAELIKLLESK